MSKYTTQIRFICETYSGLDESKGYDSVEEIIKKSRSGIFDFDYPIFDNAYKSVLETKIIRHYYTREICAETVGLWKLWLSARMNEIMPYYNKLYESELIKFNPLYATDINKVGNNKKVDNEKTVNSKTRTDNLNAKRTDDLRTSSSYTDTHRHSDTPQGSLVGLTSGEYLTDAYIDEHTGQDAIHTGTQEMKNTGTQTTKDNNTRDLNSVGDYVEHVYGYNGYYPSEMIRKYRETFLNIDKMIIDDLSDLFFNLY